MTKNKLNLIFIANHLKELTELVNSPKTLEQIAFSNPDYLKQLEKDTQDILAELYPVIEENQKKAFAELGL